MPGQGNSGTWRVYRYTSSKKGAFLDFDLPERVIRFLWKYGNFDFRYTFWKEVCYYLVIKYLLEGIKIWKY